MGGNDGHRPNAPIQMSESSKLSRRGALLAPPPAVNRGERREGPLRIPEELRARHGVKWDMRCRLVGLALSLLTLVGCSACGCVPPCEQVADMSAVKNAGGRIPIRFLEAVGCADRVWLRSQADWEHGGARQLWSLGRNDAAPVHHGDVDVIDLHRTSDHQLLVLHAGARSSDVVLSSLRRGVLTEVASLKLPEGAVPVGVAEAGGRPVVVADVQICQLEVSREWRCRPITPPIGEVARWVGVSLAIPSGGKRAYLGLDRGSGGGGLLSIDLETGAAHSVGVASTLEPGQPSLQYVPLQSVVPHPTEPECVLTAPGTSTGKTWTVVKVCGDSPSIELERPLGLDRADRFGDASPIHSLVADGRGYYGVSAGAIFRSGLPGLAWEPLPPLKSVGGLRVSRDIVGVTVVCGSQDWRRHCEEALLAVTP